MQAPNSVCSNSFNLFATLLNVIVLAGVCVKCGEKVIGESSGCTAMEQVYHITCFTCHQCAANLQGKPFYSLDGKPYCDEDYLVTFYSIKR